MSTANDTAKETLAGCRLRTLGHEESRACLDWLLGRTDSPDWTAGLGIRWALAHADDGVTWGRRDAETGAWRFGNDVCPEVSPRLRAVTLQELRLFGPAGEILIWRTDSGLRGRVIEDEDAGEGAPQPAEERRILLGDRVRDVFDGGFTRLVSRTGAEQVVPVAVDDRDLRARRLRLRVRHYFATDPESGAVRAAATRLVAVELDEEA